MHEKSDAQLVVLAREGDKNAFGYLARRYQSMAERIAMGMVANGFLAQELAQEAILQAYLSLDHLRVNDRFKSWLYITIRASQNRYGKRYVLGGLNCYPKD